MMSGTELKIARGLPAALLAGLLAIAAGCGIPHARPAQVAARPSPEPSGAVEVADPSGAAVEIPEERAGPADYVVTVDGVGLETAELEARLDELFKGADRIPAPMKAAMRAQRREELIDKFINKTLMLNEIERQNIAIEDSDIERAVREVKAMSQSVVHTFEEFIEQFYNAESVEEFRKGLADDPGLKANKLLRAATDPDMPPITDEEREAFYEEYKDKFVLGEAIRARHILVSCEPDADAETVRAKRAEAEECRKKLLEGADFAELAAEHSGCPSGEKGGRLFPFVRGTMLPEFEEAAFSREVGEIGELVTTEYGFHVIQVQSRTPAHTNTLAESTDLIDLVLDTRKREPLIEEYVESLRAKAEIVRTVAEE